MNLRLLAASAGVHLDGELPDVNIRSIVCRAEDAAPETLFICVKGRSYDSHLDALAAQQKGAVTVGERAGPGVMLLTADSRRAGARLISALHSHPARRLALIGVTGTNGKTTTAHLLWQLINGCGRSCGYIGTLGALYGGKREKLHNTTPEPDVLYPLFDRMLHIGTDSAVMEVSSQALDQHRTDGLRFSLGVFLNLTRDHLDYHGSMEAYFAAKAELFSVCRAALINTDDAYGRRLITMLPPDCKLYTFAVGTAADYRIDPISVDLSGSRFAVWEQKTGIREEFFVPLIGDALLFDAAAAVIAARIAFGLSFSKSKLLLAKAEAVAGRAQKIDIDAPFTVLCDYAHTPDALSRLFDCLNRIKGSGRLIGVYGCGGDRDKGKRPIMARVGDKTDLLVLTSDNPRSEDPAKILEDMKKGLLNESKCSIIVNRTEAIRFALSAARDEDIIALCGKGHEDYQLIGTSVLPMDETAIVKNAWHEIKARRI